MLRIFNDDARVGVDDEQRTRAGVGAICTEAQARRKSAGDPNELLKNLPLILIER